MYELRWRIDLFGIKNLQYRNKGFYVDAAGAFCGLTEWSEWKDVQEASDIKDENSSVSSLPSSPNP